MLSELLKVQLNPEYFVNSLIDLGINKSETEECDSTKIRLVSPIDKYKAIESDIYEKWYQECHKREARNKENSANRQEEKPEDNSADGARQCIESQPYDCIVIDGFSQLSDGELNDISYDYFTFLAQHNHVTAVDMISEKVEKLNKKRTLQSPCSGNIRHTTIQTR